MKIKSLLTALLFITSGLLNASNEIYLDQIGSAGIFNISQIGSANNLGEGTNRSRIEGEEVIFNIATIGNENLIDIDSIGNEEIVNLELQGDANEFILALEGDKNEINAFVAGDSNNVLIAGNEDDTQKATVHNGLINLNIEGASNAVDLLLFDTSYTFTDYHIAGSLNEVSSYQEGHGGLIGHSQLVDIFGSSNSLLVSQVGAESQFIELSILGNENAYQIFQTDGSFDPTFMPEQIDNNVIPFNEFSNPDGPPQAGNE
tara:strand:- start:13209 stop:13988 length:780 start_codon:yes stop_codon:yes gene_type:complete